MESPSKNKAFFPLLLTFFFWGSVYVAGKMVSQDIPPQLLACLRCTVAMAPLLLMARKYLGMKIAREDWKYFLLVGFTGYFLTISLIQLGISLTGASMASLINSMTPVSVTAMAALEKEGAYLANEEEAEKLKAVMWDETGHRLPNTVAISPQKLAEAAGFEIPADRKFIAITGGGRENIGKEHFFSSEKLTTLLTLFKYQGEFENALEMMQAVFNVGGKGHSCGIYSFSDDHIHRLGMAAPVSRIMVRQPNNRGNSGSANNGMPPTSSMGCGTWGGNIVSENITLKHYMNTTWVARPLPTDMPSNEELFGEFCKEGMDEE